MNRRIVGLTGLPGAGKDSVASLFKQRGFALYRFSDEIRAEASRRGLFNPTREQLQILGDELRDRFGPGVLGARLAARIVASASARSVTNGVRHLAEWQEIRSRLRGDALLIAVVAPAAIRFDRLLARAREGDPRSQEEFVEMDTRDLGSGLPTAHLQVGVVIANADVRIENDSTHDELKGSVDRLLEHIG